MDQTRKDMNELTEIYQKMIEHTSFNDMITLQRTLDNAFKQKQIEIQAMKQHDGKRIIPLTVELGNTVDSLIVKVKDVSPRGEIHLAEDMEVEFPIGRAGGSSRINYFNLEENQDRLEKRGENLKITRVEEGCFSKGLVVEEVVAEESGSARISNRTKTETEEKTMKKARSGSAGRGGKSSVVGMGGVGKTKIVNHSEVNMSFGNIQL